MEHVVEPVNDESLAQQKAAQWKKAIQAAYAF
jgi:hypothetical protein